VKILPWVVGVRGLLKVSVFAPIFRFLSISNPRRITLLEETALESAKAFYFLHQTRRAAIHPQNTVSGGFATDDPGRSCNRKQKRRSVEEYVETRKKMETDGSNNARMMLTINDGSNFFSAPTIYFLSKQKLESKRRERE
jgi:hypothetical protein